ncbi:hypothetical protein [Bordetella genomosp. 13]|uniref:hypothetical protein n=1 Tax=Bordetella genomosp. 13 TaxID=463040 RepID=UPI00119DFFF0|nr:hypothetical protein [Bordetella genomosp. 13]
MSTLSALLFFVVQHSIAVFMALTGAGLLIGLYALARRGSAWGFILMIPMVILGAANAMFGNFLNAAFLNAAGTEGTAVMIDSRETSMLLNEQRVYEHDVVVKPASGPSVATTFTTMSVAIWPIRNEILIPPEGQSFKVKYVPGVERNIVIMSDESAYGQARLLRQEQAAVERAERQWRAGPDNDAFRQEYRQALTAFIDRHQDLGGSDLLADVVARYRNQLRALEN